MEICSQVEPKVGKVGAYYPSQSLHQNCVRLTSAAGTDSFAVQWPEVHSELGLPDLISARKELLVTLFDLRAQGLELCGIVELFEDADAACNELWEIADTLRVFEPVSVGGQLEDVNPGVIFSKNIYFPLDCQQETDQQKIDNKIRRLRYHYSMRDVIQKMEADVERLTCNMLQESSGSKRYMDWDHMPLKTPSKNKVFAINFEPDIAEMHKQMMFGQLLINGFQQDRVEFVNGILETLRIEALAKALEMKDRLGGQKGRKWGIGTDIEGPRERYLISKQMLIHRQITKNQRDTAGREYQDATSHNTVLFKPVVSTPLDTDSGSKRYRGPEDQDLSGGDPTDSVPGSFEDNKELDSSYGFIHPERVKLLKRFKREDQSIQKLTMGVEGLGINGWGRGEGRINGVRNGVKMERVVGDGAKGAEGRKRVFRTGANTAELLPRGK